MVEISQNLQGQVSLTVTGGINVAIQPQVAEVVPPMQEVGVYDGWSDEEERVYLNNEVDRLRATATVTGTTLDRRERDRDGAGA